MSSYAGLKIVEVEHMTDLVEDWSGVRSPARAARRRKRGFPQRIKIYMKPKSEAFRIRDTLYMHPEMARQLREATNP